MTVGQNIRALRKKRGLTQGELGELCGISAAAVCAYERGRTLPKKRMLENMAGALGVPPSRLTEEPCPPAPVPETPEPLFSGVIGALKLLYGQAEGRTVANGSGSRTKYYAFGPEPCVLYEQDIAAMAQAARASLLPMAERMRRQAGRKLG